MLNDRAFKTGTIHDNFLISPSEAKNLREQYKKGLLFVHKLHVYNMFYWLYLISLNFKEKDNKLDNFINKLEVSVNENKALETNRALLGAGEISNGSFTRRKMI